MREFLLHSRTGYTSPGFKSLMEGGRLDIVYQCALMALFKSAAHRQDVVFHAILNGPPNPPVHIAISGMELRDARTDERSWERILKNVIAGKSHSGISVDRTPFQRFIKEKSEAGYKIFVLSDEGEALGDQKTEENMLFVLGDHVGLPKNDEGFALRYGTKVSLGREKYLAASCIDIVNHYLDQI
jgi:tRNA (pseudouridine54-N1)-methyltransferase